MRCIGNFFFRPRHPSLKRSECAGLRWETQRTFLLKKILKLRVNILEKRKSDFYYCVVEKLCYNDHKLENKRYEMRAFESSNNIWEAGEHKFTIYEGSRTSTFSTTVQKIWEMTSKGCLLVKAFLTLLLWCFSYVI